ncbi:DUF3140 domain-containing protein [Pontibacter sp. E15-1]|uniref:DUF3140 domain-containing protein n=1 Tax=Pontibacter sp. E15-1 TaxID=2919918 RepID=UPI001F4F973F|nr:DUF3140 domain-containing protein [Pontibacter sp. E15-1]MCJ8166693.1 DUF3140 domain-containing protein [Pontibacter sp. E15-1]
MENKQQQENEETYQRFTELVNMAPKEIEEWLKTDESKRVGQDSGDGESIGHKSGQRIIEIKHKKKADLNEQDYGHMRKVISYISRHTAQEPAHDKETSNWRYSLKNWGHDPMK